ncbi:MAG: AMP-binding protein [Lentimicrobium sp.]|nr:AMP-binding protein [Lentimicrobium sp.]
MNIPSSLIIGNKYHQAGGLREYANALANGNETWQKDVGNFLLAWLSPTPEISVQTSGSTGTPRFISHTKAAMIESAKATGQMLKLEAGQTALLCLSANTIAGMMMMVRAMVFQMNLMIVKPSAHPLSEIRESIIPDFAAMVPVQVYNSLKSKNEFTILSKIGNLIIGGGEISKSLEDELIDFPNALFATFGMTETITHIALRQLNGENRSAFFRVLPGISISTDERNCLLIDAPRIRPGRIITNDLVEMIASDKFIWLGRYDNVINRGGLKIIPELIENKIAGEIKNRFFVTGIADEKYGQIPVLVIESAAFEKQEEEILLKKLQSLVQKSLLPIKIFTVKSFTETHSGKVNRGKTLQKSGIQGF